MSHFGAGRIKIYYNTYYWTSRQFAARRTGRKGHLMRSRMGDPNIGRRPTYAEYVQDLIRGDEMNRSEDYTPPIRTYAFYDLDGNGTEELLIFSDDLITSVVGMKDGLTYEGNDLILFGGLRRQTLRGFFDKLKAPNRVLSHSLLNIQRKIKIMVWL